MPSNEDIQQIISTESVFSESSDVSLKNVIVHSTTKEGTNVKARVTISFTASRGGTWANEGARDPIPMFKSIERGENSVDATAVFTKYDDGKWHLEKFLQ